MRNERWGWLYDSHAKIVVKMFDGRGMRRRDHMALFLVRTALDVKECGPSVLLHPRELWDSWKHQTRRTEQTPREKEVRESLGVLLEDVRRKALDEALDVLRSLNLRREATRLKKIYRRRR